MSYAVRISLPKGARDRSLQVCGAVGLARSESRVLDCNTAGDRVIGASRGGLCVGPRPA